VRLLEVRSESGCLYPAYDWYEGASPPTNTRSVVLIAFDDFNRVIIVSAWL
jgi:hypothetical protein